MASDPDVGLDDLLLDSATARRTYTTTGHGDARTEERNISGATMRAVLHHGVVTRLAEGVWTLESTLASVCAAPSDGTPTIVTAYWNVVAGDFSTGDGGDVYHFAVTGRHVAYVGALGGAEVVVGVGTLEGAEREEVGDGGKRHVNVYSVLETILPTAEDPTALGIGGGAVGTTAAASAPAAPRTPRSRVVRMSVSDPVLEDVAASAASTLPRGHDVWSGAQGTGPTPEQVAAGAAALERGRMAVTITELAGADARQRVWTQVRAAPTTATAAASTATTVSAAATRAMLLAKLWAAMRCVAVPRQTAVSGRINFPQRPGIDTWLLQLPLPAVPGSAAGTLTGEYTLSLTLPSTLAQVGSFVGDRAWAWDRSAPSGTTSSGGIAQVGVALFEGKVDDAEAATFTAGAGAVAPGATAPVLSAAPAAAGAASDDAAVWGLAPGASLPRGPDASWRGGKAHVTPYDVSGPPIFDIVAAGGMSQATFLRQKKVSTTAGTDVPVAPRVVHHVAVARVLVDMFTDDTYDVLHHDGLAIGYLDAAPGASGSVDPSVLRAPVLGSAACRDDGNVPATLVLPASPDSIGDASVSFFGGPLIARGMTEGRTNVADCGRVTARLPEGSGTPLEPRALTAQLTFPQVLELTAAFDAAVSTGADCGGAAAATGGAATTPSPATVTELPPMTLLAAVYCPYHAVEIVEGDAVRLLAALRSNARCLSSFDQHVRTGKAHHTALSRACGMSKSANVEQLMRFYRRAFTPYQLKAVMEKRTGTHGFDSAFVASINEWEGHFHIAWLLVSMGYVPTADDWRRLDHKLGKHKRAGDRAAPYANLSAFMEQLATVCPPPAYARKPAASGGSAAFAKRSPAPTHTAASPACPTAGGAASRPSPAAAAAAAWASGPGSRSSPSTGAGAATPGGGGFARRSPATSGAPQYGRGGGTGGFGSRKDDGKDGKGIDGPSWR